MQERSNINWRALIFSIIISVGTGFISSLITRNSMMLYNQLQRPPLSPDSTVFPIVWLILYVLMGISAYMVYVRTESFNSALKIYAVQLLFNFLWPIAFFTLKLYLFSFIWIMALWVLIIIMISKFAKISKTAAWLQVPYLIWITFAAYLNLGVYLLNR